MLIEDTGYPHDPRTIILIPETLELLRAAKARDLLVGVVTNQSGIGRGFFGWEAFAAVQDAIDAAARAAGGHIDFVLACPVVRDGAHPWRKPLPGMLLAAKERLGLAMARSLMIGDRSSDMAAGQGAGVTNLALLTENDADRLEVSPWDRVGRPQLGGWFLRKTGADACPRGTESGI